MKLKNLSVLLTTILVSSMVLGCAKSNNSSSGSTDSNVIYGQVTSVSDDAITINVGTMKEMGDKPDGNQKREKSSEQSSDNNETKSENNKPDGMQSMLDFTDESKTISISGSTTISKQQMGRGNQNMGQPGNQPPQGDNNGNTPPEKPSDSNDSDSDNSKDSSGDNKIANSNQSSGSNETTETKQTDTNNGETKNRNKNNNQETEIISLSDISEGDTVKITLDSSGKAIDITVISMGQPQQSGLQPGNQT